MRKLALLAATLVFVVIGMSLAEDPECITTDTLDYCAKLERKMDSLANVPPHAQALRMQGQTMCEHGQIRAGLARLRRAVIMSRNGDSADSK